MDLQTEMDEYYNLLLEKEKIESRIAEIRGDLEGKMEKDGVNALEIVTTKGIHWTAKSIEVTRKDLNKEKVKSYLGEAKYSLCIEEKQFRQLRITQKL